MNLSQELIICMQSISVPRFTKLDRETTASVNAEKQTVDGGVWTKRLLTDDTLSRIGKVATAARAYHYGVTVPWTYHGQAVIAVARYNDYKTTMTRHKAMFDSLVGEFVANYENIINAQQERLQEDFKANEYPTINNIASRFGFTISFEPLLDVNDIRTSLPQTEKDIIKNVYKTKLKNQATAIKTILLERVLKMLDGDGKSLYGYIDRMSAPSNTFKQSMIDNATSLKETIESLDLDGSLISVTTPLAGLTLYNRAMIKKDDRLREYLHQQAMNLRQIVIDALDKPWTTTGTIAINAATNTTASNVVTETVEEGTKNSETVNTETINDSTETVNTEIVNNKETETEIEETVETSNDEETVNKQSLLDYL